MHWPGPHHQLPAHEDLHLQADSESRRERVRCSCSSQDLAGSQDCRCSYNYWRIIGFASPEGINIMQTAEQMFADGTFQVCVIICTTKTGIIKQPLIGSSSFRLLIIYKFHITANTDFRKSTFRAKILCVCVCVCLSVWSSFS